MSRRILVIDDEQGIRAALGQLLEYEGYEVHTVANANEGIAEYQKRERRYGGLLEGAHNTKAAAR